MRILIYSLLLFLIINHLEAGRRFGRSSSSRSSSSRSSSSRSSSWGSSRSSSSYPTSSRSSSSYPSSSRSSSSYPTSSRSSSSWGSSVSKPSSSRSRSFGFGRRSSSSSPSSRSSSSGSSWFSRSRSSSSSKSTYPKQSWGSGTSSSYPKQNFGTGSSSTNFGSGGFTNKNKVGSSGLSGSYLGGGGFVAPKPAKTNFGSSNYGTKNNFGSYGGTSSKSGFGSSAFSNTGHSGSSFGKTAGAGLLGAGAGSLGAKTFGSKSGFGHNSGFGSSSFGNTGKSAFGHNSGFGSSSFGNTGRSSSSFGKKVGVGLLGAGGVALGAKALGSKSGFRKNPFGINQYSSFGKPKKSFGSYLFGGKKNYGSRVPGYGTNWGTNFGGGMGRYGTGKKGFSKKALGLGIGAGFLGGAALGVGGTMATYSAMHKYKEFKRRLFGRRRYHHSRGYDRDWDDDNWDYDRPYEDDYYRNYYQRNECYDGCPANSHCEWSFCECNYGYTKKWGRCESDWGRIPQTQIQQYRPTSFDPFKSCSTSSDCLSMDMNLVCNKDLTTQGSVGQCECRRDMKWNTDALECQMYMDADCSKFNYDTPPSATIQAAVEKARREMEENEGLLGEGIILDRTQSQNETLSTSLLRFIDEKQASEDDLLEAYCRDVDAHSFELGQPERQQQNIVLSVPQQPPQALDPERPPNCLPIPRTACAVAYDEKDCTSGWKLIIPEGQLRFKWMGLYYAYRNDIETIGVRAGCTFTGFSDSSYNGERISISTDSQGYDRWVALGDEAKYLHMNEDIESVQCVCRS